MDDGIWSNTYDGRGNRVGALQAKPATDRQKLENAILCAQPHSASKTRINVPAAIMTTLCDAARKHLETLPNPVWRVTAYLPNSANRAAPYETPSRDAALDFARNYLKQGMTHVNVYQVRS